MSLRNSAISFFKKYVAPSREHRMIFLGAGIAILSMDAYVLVVIRAAIGANASRNWCKREEHKEYCQEYLDREGNNPPEAERYGDKVGNAAMIGAVPAVLIGSAAVFVGLLITYNLFRAWKRHRTQGASSSLLNGAQMRSYS